MNGGFQFVDAAGALGDGRALVVRIPRHISSKQKLFSVLADKLHFPDYFGWNWDALEECLSDLSWLPKVSTVYLVHEDLPFGAGGNNRAIYLDILRRLANSDHYQARITCVFPAELREQIVR